MRRRTCIFLSEENKSIWCLFTMHMQKLVGCLQNKGCPQFLDGDIVWTGEKTVTQYVSTRRSKEHERVTESKILGDARRGRNVGCRKSGDVPFPRFGGTDSNSTRISRSLRSCGIRKEDDSWPAPVARNRVSICPPVPSVGRQGLTSCSAINRAAAVASFYSSFRSHLLFNFIFSAHHLRYPSAICYLGAAQGQRKKENENLEPIVNGVE
ncbi:uncharacterized protein LOC117231575 isoform X1 [Bombus vosnesenskii]|uniref:Uncharacterized protein LOC117231575 isoform X1 n=2 Tax=Bombus vosnesenskii TaxID=207650 RepID=A0A6J3JYW7_9HYME|nr:uncharacterized protein LOC117231575 isoform X1 [Bombus vosnesenskii]